MPFEKGQSGNPGGRPKALRDVIGAARVHTQDAIATLASITTNPEAPEAARISAAIALLDRGWGRPTQRQEQLGPDGQPIDSRQVVMLKIER